MIDRRDVLKTAAAAAAAGSLLPLGDAVANPVPAPAGPRLVLRRAGERGHKDHGWLDTWHTFSFASYYDPRHMGFRALRVINDDKIAGGGGFPMHPHQDMEIVTYVLSGGLQHKDSMGNGSVIVPGRSQRMSAGRGIFHSEFNPSARETTHLLQIWMVPDRDKLGVKPSYEEKQIADSEKRGRWRVIASPDGRDGSIRYGTDTNLHATILAPGERVAFRNRQGRHVWLHLARGSAVLNGIPLVAGDAASTSDAGDLVLAATANAEALLFDLA